MWDAWLGARLPVQSTPDREVRFDLGDPWSLVLWRERSAASMAPLRLVLGVRGLRSVGPLGRRGRARVAAQPCCWSRDVGSASCSSALSSCPVGGMRMSVPSLAVAAIMVMIALAMFWLASSRCVTVA